MWDDVLNSNSGSANYLNSNWQTKRSVTNQQANGYNQIAPRWRKDKRPLSTHTNSSQMSCPIEAGITPLSTSDNGQAEKLANIDCEDIEVKQNTNEWIQLRSKADRKTTEGIWTANLPCMYKEEYSVDLIHHKVGFNNITGLISTTTDLSTITSPDKTGRHMIFDARTPMNKTKIKQRSKSLAFHYNFNDFIANNKELVP